MKIFQRGSWAAGFGLVAVLLMTGCKSSPKVDWNSRVGNFTYDQAVTELGPPDKLAKLSDGRMVVDWIQGQKRSSSVSIGTGIFSGGHHGGTSVGVGQTMGGGYSDKVLRLSFGPDNYLMNWSKNY